LVSGLALRFDEIENRNKILNDELIKCNNEINGMKQNIYCQSEEINSLRKEMKNQTQKFEKQEK
jgi:hypothetical protein